MVAAALVVGVQATSEPAEAYVTSTVEGQAGFQGFQDPLNIDVCWNPSLPAIWVEATRRALLAWNEATPWVRFRSLRPVSSIAYPAGCDVFVNNELADYDLTRPGIDPVTLQPILIDEPDGIVSDEESNTRASGGRSSEPSGTGPSTTWSTFSGYVKVNSRATQMQGRTEDDLLGFQSTMLHELGHVLGLGHSLETASVMKQNGNAFRAPQDDDIAGLSYIYSKVTLVQPLPEPFVTTDPVTSMTEVFWPSADLPAEDLPVVTAPIGTPTEEPSISTPTDASATDETAADAGTDDAPTAPDLTWPTAEPEPSDDVDPRDADKEGTDDSDSDSNKDVASEGRTVVAAPSPLSIVALEAGVLLCIFALILAGLRRRHRHND